MLINEAATRCNITKKAIHYYEQQGLITVKCSENGYRIYSDDDIAVLKEITIYRKLGLRVQDIKQVLMSEDKVKALQDFKAIKEFQIQQAQAQFDFLNVLLEGGSTIEEVFHEIEIKLDANMMIKDKLLLAFPGNYGQYLNLHFGQFLDGKIDTNDKIIAYQQIVDFLDNMSNLELPEDLQHFLAGTFDSLSETHLKEMSEGFDSAIKDLDNYLDVNHESIVNYLNYRNSDEYKSSPAYRMQQLFITFQESTGYYDNFIPNLKIVSGSYSQYLDKLQAANDKFMTKYEVSSDLLY